MRRLRPLVPATLVTLATLVLIIGALALWIDRVALDTPTWTDTSTELLTSPVVTAPLSNAIADRLDQRVDFQQEVTGVLPPALDQFAPVIAGGMHTLVQQTTERVLTSEQFETVWRTVNERAHRDLVRVLRGDTALQTSDGNVVLDLRPLMSQVAQTAGLPGTRLANLPPDVGTVTILPADKLETPQKITRLLDASATWLAFVAFALYAAAIWFAHDRRRQLWMAGVGAIIATFVLILIRRLGGGYLADNIGVKEQARPVVRYAWDVVSEGLVAIETTIFAVGVIAVLGAWLAGPRGLAVRIRGMIGPWMSDPRHAYGALAGVVLVLVAWGPTPAARNPLAILVLGGALVLGVELLRRQMVREAPATSAPA